MPNLFGKAEIKIPHVKSHKELLRTRSLPKSKIQNRKSKIPTPQLARQKELRLSCQKSTIIFESLNFLAISDLELSICWSMVQGSIPVSTLGPSLSSRVKLVSLTTALPIMIHCVTAPMRQGFQFSAAQDRRA